MQHTQPREWLITVQDFCGCGCGGRVSLSTIARCVLEEVKSGRQDDPCRMISCGWMWRPGVPRVWHTNDAPLVCQYFYLFKQNSAHPCTPCTLCAALEPPTLGTIVTHHTTWCHRFSHAQGGGPGRSACTCLRSPPPKPHKACAGPRTAQCYALPDYIPSIIQHPMPTTLL